MVIEFMMKEIKDKMRKRGCWVKLCHDTYGIKFPSGRLLRLGDDGFTFNKKELDIDMEDPIDALVSIYDLDSDSVLDKQGTAFGILFIGVLINMLMNHIVFGWNMLFFIPLTPIVIFMVVFSGDYMCVKSYKIWRKVCPL